MTAEERERIVSQDYADLLIEYGGDMSVFDQFPNSTIQIINYLYAVVHVPVSLINNNTITKYGYAAMPKCYSVISQSSMEASEIVRLRNIPNFNFRGQGVLLGIIDTGIDYTNKVFQNADGTTRIASIWDQSIQSNNPPARYEYGTEYTRDQINEALRNANPLSIVPSTDENGHGTMVAGIAGGSENQQNNFVGVAPDSEFVVVKLKPAKQYLKNFFFIPGNAVCFQETDIFFAMDYLLNMAYNLKRPMSICIALGSSQGAHDGQGILSNYLSLSATREGIATNIAAGNEGNARRHYYGTVSAATRYDTVELNVGANVAGFSMEIWGQSPSLFSFDVTSPSGEYISRISTGRDENRQITFVFEPTTLYVDFQIVESQSGDQLILIRFEKPSTGIWRFRIYESGDLNLGFHIWLPMQGFISDDTYFIHSNPYTTILDLGNAEVPVTITAYNDADNSLYLNASRGYTRIGVIKPDVAAPGVNILGPTPNKEFQQFTGTSPAVAHTAGISAMMLEWGIVRNNLPDMSTEDIRKLMIRGARRDPNTEYPNRDWGYGILDIYNVFDALRTVSSPKMP